MNWCKLLGWLIPSLCKKAVVIYVPWENYPWNNDTIPRLLIYSGEKPTRKANWYLDVTKYNEVVFVGKVVCPVPEAVTGDDLFSGGIVLHYIQEEPKPYEDHYSYHFPKNLWHEFVRRVTIPGIAADGVDANGNAFPQVSLENTVLVAHGLKNKKVTGIDVDHAPTNILHYLYCENNTFEVSGKDSGRVRTNVNLGAVRSEYSGGNKVVFKDVESRGVVFRADQSTAPEVLDGTCKGGALLRDVGLVHTYQGGQVRIKSTFKAERLGPWMRGPLFVAGCYFDAGSKPCEVEGGASLVGTDVGIAVFESFGHQIGQFQTDAPIRIEKVAGTGSYTETT